MKQNILYIGLNGYAGAGKDTVAKMLKVLLNNDWKSYEDYQSYFKRWYSNDDGIQYATFSNLDRDNTKVMTIAFADQLKLICSNMFGIPLKYFYYNKANAWVNINGDFEFTEIRPDKSRIISAEQYYSNLNYYNADKFEKYWMSLRDVLVYVGTYVCQASISDSIFINIVNNTIKEESLNNIELKYALITDVRFVQELEYIKNKGGIVINITRNNLEQLDNVAEHNLDEIDEYDFIIENNGSYDDLLIKVWDLVHNNDIFKNECIQLDARYNTNNYIRLIKSKDDFNLWQLYTEYGALRIHKSDGKILMIDPTGGPMMNVGDEIVDNNLNKYIIKNIEYSNKWILETTKADCVNK